MSLEMFQISEVRELYGSFPGSAAQSGSTTVAWSISTSGTSLATGCTSINSAFRLFMVCGRFDAAVSSGVSIILDQGAGGSSYDTIIASSSLSSETDWSYIPSSPLIFPAGSACKITLTAPNTSGATRYVTFIIGY